MRTRLHRPRRRRRVAAAALAAAFAILAASCATNPVTGKNEFSLMPESEEIRVGAEADKDLRAEMGVYNDPVLQQYVTGVGMRLAASGQRPNLPWHFAVVDEADVNAFALPGGYVYITRGLLAYLDTEAEMAGVLGHEIGHVNARHAAAGYTRQVTLIGGAVLTSILFPKATPYVAGGAAGLSILFLKYDRNQELQADRLGAEYSARVGWSPMGMEGVLEVLTRLEAGSNSRGVPNWLSTHPRSDDRISRIDPSVQTLLAAAPAGGWVENRDPYLQRIDGMVFGDNPRDGLVRGNVFVHPDLRFQVAFPDGWTINNGKTEVMAKAPGDQTAAMMLKLVDRSAGASLEDAATDGHEEGRLRVAARRPVHGARAAGVPRHVRGDGRERRHRPHAGRARGARRPRHHGGRHDAAVAVQRAARDLRLLDRDLLAARARGRGADHAQPPGVRHRARGRHVGVDREADRRADQAAVPGDPQ